jgi:hypothetical protein
MWGNTTTGVPWLNEPWPTAPALPAKIRANESIAQALFFQEDEPCEVSYADKKRKYLKLRVGFFLLMLGSVANLVAGLIWYWEPPRWG